MKRSEYEIQAPAFRESLLAQASKPQSEQKWPPVDEWLTVEGTSTCTTPNCVAVGVAFPVTLHENADGVFRGQCGNCNQPIIPEPMFEEE
jgi:hypothetical protein